MLSPQASPILSPRTEYIANDWNTQISSLLIVTCILICPVLLIPADDLLFLLMGSAAALIVSQAFILASARLQSRRQIDVSAFLAVPLVISALQNVYLGLVAPYANPLAIQLALMAHVTYIVAFSVTYWFARPSEAIPPLVAPAFWITVAIALFGVLSIALFKAPLIAMVTSARNMVTPVVFLFAGLIAAKHVDIRNFTRFVFIVAWASIVFGFFEYLLSDVVWSVLNIDILWLKKGIPNLTSWGLPANFVSSERFFGSQIRRMASFYADPVNFGTVLFLFFALAWFMKRRWLAFFCLVAIALSISKGAVLGLLIMGAFVTHHSGNRMLFVSVLAAAAMFGGAVVLYSLTHSTQSLMAHVQGFTASLASLPSHPFGRGLGGVGVLASGTSDVRESGFGLMIGQLGLLAIALYGYLFVTMWRATSRIVDPRRKLLGRILFSAIVLNIAFNEVALSPNSCAGYFLMLGFLIGNPGGESRCSVPPHFPARGSRT